MHRLRPQLPPTNLRPHGTMVRHPFSEVPDYAAALGLDVGAVGDDAVDLRPAFATGMPQGTVDVGKGLVDLTCQVFRDEGRQAEVCR